MVSPVGVIDQRDHHRHRRGHQRHPQVLDNRDHPIVTAEFTGDCNQPGCTTGDERQRAGERADVAVQPEQCARDDGQQQGGDGNRDHDRPVRSERTDRVAMHHGSDVDAEHTLGRYPRGPGDPVGGQRRQRQRDPDDQCGKQCGRRHADHGERDGHGDGDSDQQRPLGRLLQSLSERHYDKYALNNICVQHAVLAMTAENYQGITWL